MGTVIGVLVTLNLRPVISLRELTVSSSHELLNSPPAKPTPAAHLSVRHTHRRRAELTRGNAVTGVQVNRLALQSGHRESLSSSWRHHRSAAADFASDSALCCSREIPVSGDTCSCLFLWPCSKKLIQRFQVPMKNQTLIDFTWFESLKVSSLDWGKAGDEFCLQLGQRDQGSEPASEVFVGNSRVVETQIIRILN